MKERIIQRFPCQFGSKIFCNILQICLSKLSLERKSNGKIGKVTVRYSYIAPECKVWQWHIPKIILKCLRSAPQILKFLCLCSGTHSVVAHLAILVGIQRTPT